MRRRNAWLFATKVASVRFQVSIRVCFSAGERDTAVVPIFRLLQYLYITHKTLQYRLRNYAIKHGGKAGKPEPANKDGGERGKYAALAGKEAP